MKNKLRVIFAFLLIIFIDAEFYNLHTLFPQQSQKNCDNAKPNCMYNTYWSTKNEKICPPLAYKTLHDSAETSITASIGVISFEPSIDCISTVIQKKKSHYHSNF